MKTENVPLYKRLNESRTQGNWEVKNPPFLHIEAGEQWVCQLSNIKESPMPILSDEWEAETLRVSGIKVANAEYTALAVNNLENVADVLKRLMAFTINPKASGEYLDIILNDCEEALNRIS